MCADTTDDQAPGNVPGVAGAAVASERDEVDLGDLRIRDQLFGIGVVDRVRVFDSGPGGLVDGIDRGADTGAVLDGDGHVRPVSQGRGDERAGVEPGISTNQHPPARGAGQALHGADGFGDERSRPARRVHPSASQPGGDDHRRRGLRGRGGDQRVEPADVRVAEPGGLLLVTVHLDHAVINIDEHRPGTAEQWCQGSEIRQEPGSGRVELADMPERERPQE
ncbi:Uncharacterised protein [Streptococcus pneumoniae]|nr:Uncharacterised protein [Streptococcus pneumoniae]